MYVCFVERDLACEKKGHTTRKKLIQAQNSKH